MKGYTRPPEVTERLVAALRDALNVYPHLRLGQLIENARTRYAQSLGLASAPDLFNHRDEALVQALRYYITTASDA